MNAISLEKINIGDTLPPLALPPINRTTLALFAGASGITTPSTSTPITPAGPACPMCLPTACCRWRTSVAC